MGTHEELLNRWSLENSNENHLKRWWWEIDPYLFWTMILLLCIGLIMVFSASMTTSIMSYSDPYYFFKKQVVGVALSFFFS